MPLIRDTPPGELSPYILQHRDNPVDWYAFGDEAFAEARRRDVPVFVSIGYSACHWCHVMAHESFEDEATAAALNAGFVAVKVDREERPDVDALYMEAVQTIAGHGGWPLSAFVNHDGRPFYGGTYFPKDAGRGMPSFTEVLRAISDAWTSKRATFEEQAGELAAAVVERLATPAAAGPAVSAAELLDASLRRVEELFDAGHGGIGRAPKFPQAPIFELTLRAGAAGRAGALEMVETTLGAMAAGGIYDHLGGGFARYATDRDWQVPHFEKMLYDQAMCARLYCHAWQVTGDARWRQVLEETVAYVLDTLADPAGGLCSAEDADSEGEEGRFYTWTPAEFAAVLGPRRAEQAARYYGVSEAGNFEGRSILHRPAGAPLARPDEIESCRAELFAARAERVRPGLDDKVLTEWNAMFASALAEAGAATGTTTWVRAAADIARFLLASLRREDGRWLRASTRGRAAHLAVAADYAWLVDCFTRLGEATGEASWTDVARSTATGLEELFSAEDGGWYTAGSDAPPLFARGRDTRDGVTPAAGSVAANALARLGYLTGDDARIERARAAVGAAGGELARSPLAFPHLVGTACLLEAGAVEIVVAGQRPDLVAAAQRRYTPDGVLAWGEPTGGPLWEGRGGDRAFVCAGGTCTAPNDDVEGLLAAIGESEAARRSGMPA